jgi:SAM-dependent methyltransferase
MRARIGGMPNHIVYTSEYLAWRISWILAFPVISQTIFVQDDDTENDLLSDGDSNPNNHDCVWHYLSFHRLWNENGNRNHAETGCIIPLVVPPFTTTSTWLLQCEQTTLHRWKNSLGYGEITEGAVFEIIRQIRSLNCSTQVEKNGARKCQNIHTVVDLGSGTGRVVLAAALALQPKLVIGLEIVPTLHDVASQISHRWNNEYKLCNHKNTTVLDFRCCDFTIDTDWWVNKADLVFIHGTVFEDELVQNVYNICKKLKVGTWIVTVSQPLVSSRRHICDHDDKLSLECISEFCVEMSWGRGIVYIHCCLRKN